jgi:hypothetical protein
MHLSAIQRKNVLNSSGGRLLLMAVYFCLVLSKAVRHVLLIVTTVSNSF